MTTQVKNKSLAKQLAKWEAEIKKNNQAYKAANKTQKRLMVVRDVIRQIEGKFVVPENGEFVVTKNSAVCSLQENDELQAALYGTKCNCCAMGGLFVSFVRLADNCQIGNDVSFYRYYDTERKGAFTLSDGQPVLERLFPQKNLEMIEVAFELGHGQCCMEGVGTQKRCIAFGKQYKSAKTRMLAILNNMLANKGLFKP